MDSLVIVNESLKHLSDSIHVLMPDSVHIFQSPAKSTLKDYTPVFSLITSIIIAVAGFIIVERREQRKENIRIEKLKTHFLTWLEIIKMQTIKQAYEVRMFNDNIKHCSQSTSLPPINFKTFQFEQILELDKVDLTEILIIKTKDKSVNKFKLHELTVIKDELTVVLKHLKKTKPENEERIMDAKRTFTGYLVEFIKYTVDNGIDKEVAKLLYQLEEKSGCPISDFKYVMSIKEKFDRLITSNDSQILDELQGYSHYPYFIKYFEELILSFENITYRYNQLERRVLHLAHQLSVIESYYKGEITNAKFEVLYHKPAHQINEDKLYDLMGYSSYRLSKIVTPAKLVDGESLD